MSRMTRLCAAFLGSVACAIGGYVPESNAFVLTRYEASPWLLTNTHSFDWPLDTAGRHNFAHWDLREMPDCEVPWSMAPLGGTDDIPGLDEFDAVEDAFDTWNAVSPSAIKFKQRASPDGAMGPGNLDFSNIVGWGTLGPPLPAEALAVTIKWSTLGNGQVIEADIIFNDDFTWTWVGHDVAMTHNPDVETIALHEIGHVVGLGHVTPQGVMNVHNSIMKPYLWLTDDVWLGAIAAEDRHCGATLDPNTDIIGPGADEDFTTVPNNCPGGGDDGINEETGKIHCGPNGIVETITDHANHELSADDMAGCSFLYCPDLGDAIDPLLNGISQYPTVVHDLIFPGRNLNGKQLDGKAPGAEHLFGIRQRQPARNYTYEWLGGAHEDSDDVDGECFANITNGDEFDDGLSFIPNPPAWGRPLTINTFIKYANDHDGGFHSYFNDDVWLAPEGERHCSGNANPDEAIIGPGPNGVIDSPLNSCPGWGDDEIVGGNVTAGSDRLIMTVIDPHPLWLNIWIDWNQDGIWTPAENVINASFTPQRPVGPNAKGSIKKVYTGVTPGGVPHPHRPVWLRARLDWGENAGTSNNIDGSLARPAGAAQFGEVEDYPLSWDAPKYEQYIFHNVTGGGIRGIGLVFAGDASNSETFAAVVDGNDCYQPDTVPYPELFYDAGIDETFMEFIDPSGIDSCTFRHIGIGDSIPPERTDIRGFFIADSSRDSEPLIEHWLPTTNTVITPTKNTVRIVIGAVNEEVGGWITSTQVDSVLSWDDSIHVAASYRITPDVVPLDHLSPCDPLVSDLPSIDVGTAYINPERPFAFEIPWESLAHGQSVIVEIASSWSINGNEGEEILEFISPLDYLVGVEDSETTIPSGRLLEVFPNPMTGQTEIRYTIPSAAPMSLEIYDVSGRLVRVVEHSPVKRAGYDVAVWDSRTDAGHLAPPGVYFVHLSAGPFEETRKMVLVK
ncbi:GEVED domain-containing protein [Candidatus Eisenbacteria bacterium]|uniref:GEVED domain-containing protein n=1 Tax=Eiseniibacteriota bacterium TaxID=2212470 RepID=A0ABV6YKV5_UNCEI